MIALDVWVLQLACAVIMYDRNLRRVFWTSVLALVCILVKAPWTADGDAQSSASKPSAEKGNAETKAAATPPRSEQDDAKSWNGRLGKFRLVNVPMSMLLESLRQSGVRVCWEIPVDAVPGNFVDAEGVLAWYGDQPITVDLSGVTVSEAMDRIAKADPRYYWRRVPGTAIINLIPHNSRLGFEVGPVDISGGVYSVIGRSVMRNPKRFAPLGFGTVVGDFLPNVTVKMQGGTGRDFLNEVVKSIPRLCWQRNYGGLGFAMGGGLKALPDGASNELPQAAVDLEFPKLHRAEPTNVALQYRTRTKVINGERHSRMEKRPAPPPQVFHERIQKRAATLPEPEKTVLDGYRQFMQSFVQENTLLLGLRIHPDGVRNEEKKYSKAEVTAALKSVFEKMDYTDFIVDDFLDPDQVRIERLAEGKYRVTAKTKMQEFESQEYFPKEFSLTFQKWVDPQFWQIVEVNWTGLLAPQK